MTAPDLEVHPDDLAVVSTMLQRTAATLGAVDLTLQPDAGPSTGRVLAALAEVGAGAAAMAHRLAELAVTTDAVGADLSATDGDVEAAFVRRAEARR